MNRVGYVRIHLAPGVVNVRNSIIKTLLFIVRMLSMNIHVVLPEEDRHPNFTFGEFA